jgi:hypothetical protein
MRQQITVLQLAEQPADAHRVAVQHELRFGLHTPHEVVAIGQQREVGGGHIGCDAPAAEQQAIGEDEVSFTVFQNRGGGGDGVDEPVFTWVGGGKELVVRELIKFLEQVGVLRKRKKGCKDEEARYEFFHKKGLKRGRSTGKAEKDYFYTNKQGFSRC